MNEEKPKTNNFNAKAAGACGCFVAAFMIGVVVGFAWALWHYEIIGWK